MIDRFDALINKNRVYGFGMHPTVGHFTDRCAEFFRFRAQWLFEEGPGSEMKTGTSCVESDAKKNTAFDNNTGIELDAQRCSKQELKNMECEVPVVDFQSPGRQRGDHCHQGAACGCFIFLGFLATPTFHE